MSDAIFHITFRTSWLAAQNSGKYSADSLQSEGFIHCSKHDQILRVANTYFGNQTDLVLLVVDASRLNSDLRWEPGSDRLDELFPHVYGPINLDAILRVLDFPPGAGGKWNSLPL